MKLLAPDSKDQQITTDPLSRVFLHLEHKT